MKSICRGAGQRQGMSPRGRGKVCRRARPAKYTFTTAWILALTLIGAATSFAAEETSKPSDRPNFLIVIADDCTFNELPLFGGRNVQTPNLDRFASQGMIFRRAYVTMSMCTPCRTELYTGHYPMKTG